MQPPLPVRALSIRQPYAELILRGIKTVEYRSRATSIIGERFWIYAAKKKLSVASGQLPVWSKDLAMPSDLPAWMIELAEQVGMIDAGELAGLPTGVIVGSAVIEKCCPLSVVSGPSQPTTDGGPRAPLFAWHLAAVERARKLRKPQGHPQPVWFRPF